VKAIWAATLRRDAVTFTLLPKEAPFCRAASFLPRFIRG
jgi:hypothetical protein